MCNSDDYAGDDDKCWTDAIKFTAPLRKKDKVSFYDKASSQPKRTPEKGRQLEITDKSIPRYRGKPSNISAITSITDEWKFFSSIDAGTKSRIDKGKYPVDTVIDLHGCNQNTAYDKLVNFIISSFESQKRLLLVITGWGSKSLGQNSIRSSFPNWIEVGEISRVILGYRQALPWHGGKGAFYILLRANKNKCQ